MKNFINDLTVKGIHLELLNDEKLEINYFQDAPDDEIISLIRLNKNQLIDYLKSIRQNNLFKNNLVPRPSRLPLSFSQERLWFIDQLEGSIQYHMPSVLRLTGEVDIRSLAYSLKSIVQRHEVLRTVLLEDEEGTYQEVREGDNWELSVTEEGDYGDEGMLSSHISGFIGLPFDLSNDYMLRSELIRLDNGDHFLVSVLHHIASDGWSQSVLIRELVELYNSSRAERASSLAVLPVQYADYAAWQRGYLSGEFLRSDLSYWESKLSGIEPLEFPTDYLRPVIQSRSGKTLSLMIDKGLRDRLQDLGRQQETTLFMTLLSVFKVLLYRYSGQEDICVGTAIANRRHVQLEGLIGFFVNTLALRSSLDGEADFITFLNQVKETTLSAYDHQDVPFEMVVDKVVAGRDISRSPLFQVMFILQNTPDVPELVLDKMRLSPEPYENETSKFDLSFLLAEGDNGISASIEYCTDLFKEDTILRLWSHYVKLLEAVVLDPRARLSELRLLSRQEEDQLLHQFNDTKVDYPRDKTIIDLFEEQVEKTPFLSAIVYEGRDWSYQEVNERSNRLGHYLIHIGVKGGDLVGICVERSAEMIIGILAVLKAGGTYVPIDAGYPEDRIQYMLEDTHAGYILSDSRTKDRLPELPSCRVVVLDLETQAISEQLSTAVPVQINGTGLCYVMYTSGSTGRPKGVMMPESALINLLLWHQDQSCVKGEKKILQFASITFDVSFQEIFSGLCFGSTVFLLSEESRRDTNKILRILIDEKINYLLVPNVVLKNLCICANEQLLYPDHLEVIFTAGEQLQLSKSINEFIKNTKVKLINHYGPTETHIATSYEVLTADYKEYILPPIGKPISNAQVYILDKRQGLVAQGVYGEIYIGGAGLARGYLNNPELTRQKFIPNPFSADPESRLYRTGDLGRWNPEGNVEFMGRLDDQVKIRGYRIEPGEIEGVLQQSGLVDQAFVTAREDEKRGKYLVGYLCGGDQNDQNNLISYLRNRLPEYMIPFYWVWLESFPLTSNGKIDRKALLSVSAGDSIHREYVGPGNETEQKLVEIWEELLGAGRVGIHDNFFELGGHSLLVTRVVSAIRKQLEVEVGIKDIFISPTIAELSLTLSGNRTVLLPSVGSFPRPSRLPLSFSQERLWFIDQLEGSIQYHMPSVLRLTGEVDISALAYSLKSIVQRHEVLRTVLLEDEEGAYQEVRDGDSWELSVTEESDYGMLSSHISGFIGLPFDLSHDYMLRSELIRLENGDHFLVSVLHHIASDGWSLSVLVRELVELYNSSRLGRTSSLAALPVQYGDYAVWQRGYLSGEFLRSDLNYWENRLSGIEPLDFPTDYSRPVVQSRSGKTLPFVIDKGLCDRLQDLGRQQGATLFMTLLSVFKVLLYRYSGQEDICVGTAIANRRHAHLEGLIGFFVNTLALRSSLDGEDDFITFLKQVKETTLSAYDHQDVPFEMVVDKIVTGRDISRSPLFQVMFALQNTPDIPELVLDEMRLSIEPYENETSKFDLSFLLTEGDEGISASIEYCTDLFKEDTISRLWGQYLKLLEAVVLDPRVRLSELQLLSREEEERLVHQFNDTKVDYPQDKTIIDLFEEQVERTPDHIAVVFEDKELSYKQLNEQANQLGNYLRNKYNIQPGDLVGICLERSVEMIIGILAVLKAGGAYVPIDAGYPKDRIQFMLEDTHAAYVLSDSGTKNRLPQLSSYRIVMLDLEAQAISEQSSTSVPVQISRTDLCYVMYTSGSTGRPKGVMIEHRNVVNLVAAMDFIKGTEPNILLSTGSPSFDAVTFEYWSMLLNGGLLILSEEKDLLDIDLLKAMIIHHKVSTMWFSAGWFNQIVNLDKEVFAPLKTILVGGEKLSHTHVAEVQKKYGHIKIINGYGPTENTTFSLVHVIGDTGSENIPLGKPIFNAQVYILDKKQGLVPQGGWGEIYIGGAGLGRGYLNNPELTLQKFIPNPFNTDPGSRLYRTGDLGRWNPEGNVEFMGRLDDQVKIRGYRIEPGEVAEVLQQSGLVDQAFVSLKADDQGKSLVCHYIPQSSYLKEKEIFLSTKQIENWNSLYNTEYSKSESKDEQFNTTGWNNSFTGNAISDDEMYEWQNDIIGTILNEKPQDVLEIGTGTGLIYYRIASHIKKYIGIDFSNVCLEAINSHVKADPDNYPQTILKVSTADEIGFFENENIDTIIINSVIQYFPTIGYLEDVIKKCLLLLNKKGKIIIGDVRDYRLLEFFIARLTINGISPEMNIKDFLWDVDRKVLNEEELCISPDYFIDLAERYSEINNVYIEWKQGDHINELSLYRYTVVIHVGAENDSINTEWQIWDEPNSKLSFINQMEDKQEVIAIKNFPNPRLWKEKLIKLGTRSDLVKNVSHLSSFVSNPDEETKSLNDFVQYARSMGYSCRMLLNEDPFKADLLFELGVEKQFVVNQFTKSNLSKENFSNRPLFKDSCLIIQKDIRSFLSKCLPDYMIPSEYISLTKFPLTPNGKLDKKSLPVSDFFQKKGKLYSPPGNETEQKLVAIWEELLGADRVGIHDNFFELGGHSLLVTRLVSAIRKQLEVEVGIKDIFINPTIAELSLTLSGNHSVLLPSIGSFPRPSRLPLSFSQERLWFIDQLEGSIQYHIPSVLRLTGKVDISALAYSLKSIVQRHEVLRTVLLEDEEGVYQEVRKGGSWELSVTKGSDYEILSSHISGFISLPFDLSHDDMLRSELIRLENGDHLLVSVLHHIASDGWSLSVLVRELVELYNSSRAGRASSLAALPVQYGDYAAWQRDYFSGEFLHSDLSYWESKLSGIEPLNFPTDYSRPAVQSRSGKTLSFVIDKGLRDRLQDLGRQQGATLFMTLLSVFKVLLYRYSGQDDICVGTAIANRRHVQLEGLIGFFVNTLALRSSLDGEADFITFLNQVKETTLSAYDHQDVPFEMVVDKVVTNRDISRSPLFQVMFALQNTPDIPELVLDEIQLSPQPYENRTSKFDLSFLLAEGDKGIDVGIAYCTDLFKEDTISRLWSHYLKLLEAVVLDPRVRLSELQLLSREEEEQLIYQFNDTKVDYPRDKTIIGLFEEQVERTPDHIAIVFEDKELSYRQLNEQANQLGNYLRHKYNIQPDDLLGIKLGRSEKMLVGILGILKSGAAYVPIDPDYPQERINYIINDIQTKVIIDELEFETFNLQKEEYSAEIETINSPDDLAYVIYTSGSTGNPKGVMVENKSVINLIHSQTIQFAVDQSENILQSSSYSFDASVEQFFLALLNGAKLYILPKETLLDDNKLADFIFKYKITHFHGVPSIVSRLKPDHRFCLKRVISGGDICSLELAESWNGICDFYNKYGPTETTVTSIQLLYKENSAISIGRPISNTQIYILNDHLRPVPFGAIGKLYISGAGMTRGYLNKPELTIEKFIDNPFIPGERMYDTGDLAKWLPDGNIEFMGRNDQQVKIRGHRIESGEIEVCLSQYSDQIRQVIIDVKNINGEKTIVAYYVSESEINKMELRDFLHRRLPEYMVPNFYIALDRIPLNFNGKIDRKALPFVSEQDIVHREHVGPGNETEQKLVEIWEELLGVKRVGIHDNFFELGGHSLLLARVVSAIRRQLEIQVGIGLLFEYQTISEQSSVINGLDNVKLNKYDKHILLLSSNKNLEPLFVVPGIFGFCDGYAELAIGLSQKYSVYGLQMVGMFENEGPLDSMELIASKAIDFMKTVQPKGPYRFVAHSFGGHVAYEMVKQLEMNGEQVVFVCILDAPKVFNRAEVLTEKTDFNNSQLFTYLNESFNQLTKVNFDEKLLQNLINCKTDTEIKQCLFSAVNNTDIAKMLLLSFDIFKVNSHIRYDISGMIKAKLVLIKAIEQSLLDGDFLDWEMNSSTFTSDMSQGNHYNMMKGSNAAFLSDIILKHTK